MTPPLSSRRMCKSALTERVPARDANFDVVIISPTRASRHNTCHAEEKLRITNSHQNRHNIKDFRPWRLDGMS